MRFTVAYRLMLALADATFRYIGWNLSRELCYSVSVSDWTLNTIVVCYLPIYPWPGISEQSYQTAMLLCGWLCVVSVAAFACWSPQNGCAHVWMIVYRQKYYCSSHDPDSVFGDFNWKKLEQRKSATLKPWPVHPVYLYIKLFNCSLQRSGVARKICRNGIV